MAQRIKVNVDVDSESIEFATDKVLTLQQQVRALKQALQLVPEGTAEWKVLQAKFNETRDALDRVNIKSKELFGTLGALPGPIGDVSSKLNGTIDTLKVFSSVRIGDIGTQVKELGKDLGHIVKGIGDATGITKIYSIINNALSKSFVAVGIGEEAAAAGAKGFAAALTATGVGALVVVLGFAVNALMDFFDSTKESTDGVNLFNSAIAEQQRLLENDLEAIDSAGKAAVTRAKIAGKSEEELTKITKQFSKEKLDALRANDEALYNRRKELANNTVISEKDKKAAIDKLDADILKSGQTITKQILSNSQTELEAQLAAVNAKKALDDKATQKNAELVKQRQADIKTLEKAESEALLQSLSNKDKELGAVDVKYKELIDKEIKYGRSTKILTDAVEAEKQKIREKYAIEEQDFIDNALSKSGDKIEAGRKKELQGADKAYKKLYDQKVLAKEDTTKIDEAYGQQVIDINKSYDDQQIKQRQDFEAKVRSIKAGAIADDTDQKIAAREAEYTKQSDELERDLEFIKLSEEEKNALRADLRKGTDVDEFKIKKDARTKDLQDELDLLHVRGEALIAGTVSYYENRQAILDSQQALELEKVAAFEGATTEEKEKAEAQKLAINEKYKKLNADLKKEEFLQTMQYISQGLEAAKDVANAIIAVNENKMNEELKAAGEDEAKKEEIRKKYFEKNKKAQIALAYINTFQAAVSAYASLAAIPVVGPVLGAIAAAAAIVAGLANVAKIKAQEYQSPSGGGSSASIPSTQSQMAQAQAQVPTQEKSAISSQGSLGNIVSKSSNQPQSAVPSPNVTTIVTPNANQAQMTGTAVAQEANKDITPIQTYVVGTQVSSQQQLDRRVALSARMGG